MGKEMLKLSLIAILAAGTATIGFAQSDDAEATEETAAEATEAEATEAETPAEEATPPVVATPEDLAMVVGSVNGEDITLGQILLVKEQMGPQGLQGTDQEKLDTMVQQLGVQDILASQAPETPILDLQLDSAERQTRANAKLTAYVDENLTDEYLKKTYDEVIGNQPESEEYNAAHILVQTEDEAKAAKERVDGGEDFAEVAKEMSTGPSGPNGGDLGWFGAGQMVPEFEEAVKALEPGQVSDPVQTQFGWHVVILNDKRVAAKPTFEEVEPQLRDYASSKLIDEYVTEIRESSEISTAEGVDPAVINEILPQ